MIESVIQDLAFTLEKFGTGAYLIVFLFVVFETIVVVGQFIPGSLFLVLIGFLCYMRVFDFTAMTANVLIAHMCGEFINYGLGRYRGRKLFHEESRFFKPRFLDMAQSRFESSGAKLLITGQFLGFLRPFITMSAGVIHYSIWRFGIAIAIASFLWAIVPLAIGFIFGASWQKAVEYLKDFSLVLLVAIPLAFFSGWCIQRLLELSGSLYRFLEYLNQHIRQSAWYQRLSRRHPRTFAFLERRISLSKTWGLGATVGFASSLLFIGICMAILWDVHTRDNWYVFDLSMVNLLAQLRTPGADKFFLIVTNLGAAPVVTVVVTLACIASFFSRQHKTFFVILGSVILSMFFSEGLEKIFQRTRPDLDLHLVQAHGFSFPSGHATVAFALFGALYYWLWNHPGVLKVRASLAFILLLAAFLVGFSRVYLGVHYPSDVVSGFCLGFAGVLACGTIAANWTRLADVQRRADLIAAVIMLVYGLGAWIYAERNPVTPDSPIHGTREKPVQISQLKPLIQGAPRTATTLFGAPYVPVTLVLVGDPSNLFTDLKNRKWQPVAEANFFTKGMADPVFPAFLNGKPAAATFEQKSENGRRILRFWKTSVISGQDEVWLGSVVEHQRETKWNFDVYNQTPDIDLAIDHLEKELRQYNPSRIRNFRHRGLYNWKNPYFTHGGALLLEV